MTRISTFGQYGRAVDNISSLNERLAQVNERITSGRRITKPSDAPSDAGRALELRDVLADIEGFRRNVALGRQMLGSAETALTSASDLVTRAQELAVQGANDTLGDAERESLAEEVNALRAQLLSVANSQVNGQYIFSGYDTRTPAFAADGTYQGTSNQTTFDVDESERVIVKLPGDEVFGAAAGVNIIATLDRLETDLRANGADAVRANLGGLETGRDQLVQQRAFLGAQVNRLDRADERLDASEVTFKKFSSQVEDVDMVDALSEVAALQDMLDSALRSTTVLLGTSLMDFL